MGCKRESGTAESVAAHRLDVLNDEATERVRYLRSMQRDPANAEYAAVLGYDANLIEHLRYELEKERHADA